MAIAHAKQWVQAPIADVWAVWSQLEAWTYWAGVGEVTLERRGAEHEHGPGAIRTLSLMGLTLREEVTARVDQQRLSYVVHSGLPVRSCEGEVVFDERPHGTVVRWRVDLKPRVPGTGPALVAALQLGMRYVLGRLENRMAPLEAHRAECPYADSPDGHHPSLRLKGRNVVRRALLHTRRF
jgi:uncharacterized membrane protein